MLYTRAPKQLSLSSSTSVGWIWTTDLEAKGSFMLGLQEPEFLPLHFPMLSLSKVRQKQDTDIGEKCNGHQKI